MGSRYIVRSDRWIFGVYQPHTGRSVPGEQIPVSTYEVNTELNAPPVPGDVPGDGRFWSSSCCGGGAATATPTWISTGSNVATSPGLAGCQVASSVGSPLGGGGSQTSR